MLGPTEVKWLKSEDGLEFERLNNWLLQAIEAT
jgi:hypothetical protein